MFEKSSLLVSILILVAGCAFSDELAKVKFPDGTLVDCDISDTPMERTTGFSKHEQLEPDHGMIFVYPHPTSTSFWMPPQMKFNLDIIFLDKNHEIVHISHDAFPCKDPDGFDCESYSPDFEISYVVEVVAGMAKRIGLKNGDQLQIEFPMGYEHP